MFKMVTKCEILCRSIGHVFKLNSSNPIANIYRAGNINKTCLVRTLFSQPSLGLDSYVNQREWTKNQLQNLEDKFKTRMREFVLSENKNMVFTEDLKNMIHIAEDDNDLELVVKMMKKFNQQNKQIRFGNFVFGSVAMRLFYLLNKPEIAKECFTNPELEGFFDQLVTYQIFLDLLFENQLYEDVLKYFDIIKSRQIEGAKFPRNSVVLVFGACYKLNTKESAEYALKLWKDLLESGYYPTRRAVTFCGALLYNQGNSPAALEIISSAKNQRYVSVRNIKLLALTALEKYDEALLVLKSVVSEDAASNELQTFNKDVIETVEKNLVKCNNPEIVMEFGRIKDIIQKQGQISSTTLDELLCSKIQKPFTPQKTNYNDNEFYNRKQTNRRFDNRRNTNQSRQSSFRRRPGLDELQ